MQRKPSLAKKKNELERLKQGLVRYASEKKTWNWVASKVC